jgi:site-specific DNA recombinase
MVGSRVLWDKEQGEMTTTPSTVRCAIYTRKSSEEGLEQSFNSLDAQREACESYIQSQRHEGWEVVKAKYDDGGFSGGNMVRPALKRLLDDIAAKRVDTVVVYKVDRLTRSLADFAKIVEQFDKQGISFVSVTQQFNTTTSMGRLTLNVLLSFAQFEREVTGERIRDKIAASKRKGMWMGGVVPLGYDLQDHTLIPNPQEAAVIQEIFKSYLEQGCVSKLQIHLEQKRIYSKKRISKNGNATGGQVFSRGALYGLLQNRLYRGEMPHKGESYPGQHPAIIDGQLWDQVQAQFKANLQAERKRSRATEGSLLTGLLYDGRGNRFTPSHTSKKGRRYRYYISETIIKKGAKGHNSVVRLPALEVEELVAAQVTSLLKSPELVLELFTQSTTPSEDTRRLLHAVQHCRANVEPLLLSLLQRVLIHDDRLEIQLHKQVVLNVLLGENAYSLAGLPGEDGVCKLEVSAALKRRGGEVRFQFAPGTQGLNPEPVPSLINAVARAHDWVNKIIRGETANTASIAAETGLDVRYVRRHISLAFLAPDITEAILEGTHASRVSLVDWLGSPPIDWGRQRSEIQGDRCPAAN